MNGFLKKKGGGIDMGVPFSPSNLRKDHVDWRCHYIINVTQHGKRYLGGERVICFKSNIKGVVDKNA